MVTSYPLSDIRPLAIDLYCGLGGWAEGFLSEGWRVIGFDIERHDYGTGGYPGQLVLQDVRTLRGWQFKNAAVIVASPPCQAYSYRAMPWKRAKSLPPPDNTLFEQCFRIQREANYENVCYRCAGGGCDECRNSGFRYIPLIVENVRGAQKWVGRSAWNFGSYHLWGDVPALMPTGTACKQVGTWFHDTKGARQFSSHSKERKQWSAEVAKIPFPLAQHIARVFKPVLTSLLLVALLTPAPHRMVDPMFVLSEVARKSYGQFSLDFETLVTSHESKTEVTFDFDGTSIDIPQSKGVSPTEISSPRRLRVKGTDTDSLMGGRIESGETGILASDGAQANHEARPGEPYTTTDSPVITEPAALPAVLAQIAKKHQSFTDRVMARLSEAEQREINTHYQADYRQSWICLSFANRGIADPFVIASYQMYGVHPSAVWPRIVADRKERLGAEYYDWYFSNDLPRPDVPKIPPTTANADTHAAHGADLPAGTGRVGSVPNHKEVC